jgi:adenine deaminase
MSFDPVTPEVLAVSRGDAPADLLLRNGRIVNVFTGEIHDGHIAICDGRIAGVGDYSRAKEIIDLKGAHVAPGFIDAHMHVESTMMPPSQFARVAIPHGTTGAVLDPHEIANVLGIPGIRYIMDDAAQVPMSLLFAVSSCVPASPLETSGASLNAADVAPLLDDPRVVSLAEMMNYPGVVNGQADVLAKINAGLQRRLVDGHAPGLRGLALQAYLAARISSDHECTTIEEAREKLRHGMRIFIREGSAAKNLQALLPLVTPANAHRFCFCTDDRHPADLAHEGHVDHVVRQAISRGLNPATAIALGSINVAHHFRQPDMGAIAPGYMANFIVLDDLAEVRIRQVFHRGQLAAEGGRCVLDFESSIAPPRLGQTVSLPQDLTEQSFHVPASTARGNIRVIGMRPFQLVTDSLTDTPSVRDGCFVADPARDLCKFVVVERHHHTGNIGRGFIRGFGLQRGALASTVGHDSHNLSILGVNDRDMIIAARALAECGGGQCVVCDGQVLAVLPLPIAGLMSDQPVEAIILRQNELHHAARSLGCPLDDPFMPLSFMSLAVIPRLKLTDRGLVDVDRFEIVPLEV